MSVFCFCFVFACITFAFSCYDQYLEMYKRSIEDPAGFWSDIASQFYWKEKWGQEVVSENLDVRKGNIKIEVLIIILMLKTLTVNQKMDFLFS